MTDTYWRNECPCCGESNGKESWCTGDQGYECYIECLQCGLEGPDCPSLLEAIAAWNAISADSFTKA